MKLADRLAEAEIALEQALERADRLEGERDELAAEIRWNEQFGEAETLLETIADHKRGLITLDELYDRTVGR